MAAALVALAVLAGCNQPTGDEANGGGGGQAAQAPRTDVQQTRDRLGEAYVLAARTHADVVRGDYQGAAAAIKKSRAELTQAKQFARLDTQTRINEMDQAAIRVQNEIERRSLNTHQATVKFVDQMQGLFASMPPQPVTGGGGGETLQAEPEEPVPDERAPMMPAPAEPAYEESSPPEQMPGEPVVPNEPMPPMP